MPAASAMTIDGAHAPGDEAIIGDRAGQGRRRLDRIDPAHFPRARGIAARREIARGRKCPGAAPGDAVDRDDDIRLISFKVTSTGEP